jgi:replicative DNA helicase
MTEQLPPQDLHAEQATLGACLIERQAVDLVVAVGLKPQDFYREAHGTIFQALLKEHSAQRPIDLVTITARLKAMQKLDEVGGPTYLAAVLLEAPTAAHVVRYAGIVQERARLRGLISAAAEIRELAWRPDAEADDAVTRANALLDRLNTYGNGGVHGEDAAALVGRAGQGIVEAYERPVKIDGGRLGISPIDEHIGGLPRPGVTIIRGNTSFGKTALMCQIALHSAMAGESVAYINLEGGNETILAKLVQQRSAVDRFQARQDGGIKDVDVLKRVGDAADFISGLPLEFYSPGGVRFPELQALITHVRRKTNVDMVIVDFVQQLVPLARDAYLDAKETSTHLADMAVRLGVALVLGSQVTRTETGELRTRGASEFEHHAEAVITILKKVAPGEDKNTKGYDRSRLERQSPRCYLNLDKWRRGPVDTWAVVWSGARQTFFSLYEAGKTLDMTGLEADFSDDEWKEIKRGIGQAPASWV